MIQQRLKENGSPDALIETDESRSWFQITFYRHPAFSGTVPARDDDRQNLVRLLKDAFLSFTAEQLNDQADDQADDRVLEVMATMVLFLADAPKSRDELLDHAGLKKHRDTIKRYIEPLEQISWIVKTIPGKPTSPRQKYKLTDKGTFQCQYCKLADSRKEKMGHP